MTLPELLAPAGDYDILVTAINAGADAVYISGERFGARAKNTCNRKHLDKQLWSHRRCEIPVLPIQNRRWCGNCTGLGNHWTH